MKIFIYRINLVEGGIVMANYRPVKNFISAAQALSNVMINRSISTSTWGMFLLQGVGQYSNTVLRSGAVAIWSTVSAQATGTADGFTMTDTNGLYGITLNAGDPYTLRFYTHL
jgi:hypothetical protein